MESSDKGQPKRAASLPEASSNSLLEPPTDTPRHFHIIRSPTGTTGHTTGGNVNGDGNDNDNGGANGKNPSPKTVATQILTPMLSPLSASVLPCNEEQQAAFDVGQKLEQAPGAPIETERKSSNTSQDGAKLDYPLDAAYEEAFQSIRQGDEFIGIAAVKRLAHSLGVPPALRKVRDRRDLALVKVNLVCMAVTSQRAYTATSHGMCS
jgi:hypothetical protein